MPSKRGFRKELKALVIGRRAFAAQGFAERLRAAGVSVTCVHAAEFPATEPPALDAGCDVVIDFGLLRGAGLDANRARLEAVQGWCEVHGVSKLIAISSMGVYPLSAEVIDSETPIETDWSLRGVYSGIKVMQENFYVQVPRTFALEIVRPGVIYDETTRAVRTGGVFLRLWGKFGLLMGDGASTLPVITRARLQDFLVQCVQSPISEKTVVHILARGETKRWFAREILRVHALPLPRGLVLPLAKLLARCGLLPSARLSQVRGLYRHYTLRDSPQTSGAVVLHTCCGPCATACIAPLRAAGYAPVLYFANSNLDTAAEYDRRLAAAQRLAEAEGLKLIAEPYDHADWLENVARGFEDEPEKGMRCCRCYRYNIARAAAWAAQNGYRAVTSSLTLSPHKPSARVLASGAEAAHAANVEYLPFDFKKHDGFLVSLRRTRELGLYRQSYCGCEFSKRAATPPEKRT